MPERAHASVAAATVALVLLGVAACGGHSGGGAAAQIRANWVTFFSPTSSTEQKVGLLQNGSLFAGTIATIDRSSLNRQTRATVSKVAVDGMKAAVTYAISRGDRQVLGDQHGRAVLVGGVWKVSEATFCSLVVLGFPRPPHCPAPHPGTAPTRIPSGSPSP